ncbi:hypothetical protein OWV82_006185 [Melia azedarach]|uniref:Uncharacterized protein n=1 Tax=Melia azedarach TaxID=155640 RepID=A0ACC1YG19_MELAZ|nr:hypothetical protein OWV82_006185 [Melia azedarach]
MNDLNNHERKRPFAATQSQIACRICDQVFLSTQDLINHIETHMVGDETAAASRRQQRDQLPCANPNTLSQSNFPPQPLMQPAIPNVFMSQPLSERRSPVAFHNPNLRGVIWDMFPCLPVQPISSSGIGLQGLCPQRPVHFTGSGGQLLVPQRPVLEARTSSNDFTKPLIDQLQKGLPDVVQPVEEQDYNMVYNAEMHGLDLTLKL